MLKAKPAGPATYGFLNRIAQDAGNRSMRKAGRAAWNTDDAAAAQEYFERLVALYRTDGETRECTHERLQSLARGTWFEGICDG